MPNTKITSVVELSRYKIGTVLYRVVLRPVGQSHITINPGDEWMAQCHPKIFYERGMANAAWKFKTKIPKLCGIDFQYVMEILTSESIVERFEIVDVARSADTGEFYYCSPVGDWMPEGNLFESYSAARREKSKIKNLFSQWAKRTGADQV